MLPAGAVAAQVRVFLNDPTLMQPYRDALIAALAIPGGPLSSNPRLRWSRLVWTCCTAAGGQWKQAVPVAAAAELFMAALDLLDDVEDEEEHPVQAVLGSARTLNVSTGLLFLAQQAILTTVGVAAAGALLKAGLSACGGQHSDLTPTSEVCLDLDEALDAASRKSASLTAVLCRLGALVAGASDEIQERYARFGWHLGLSRQLANDIAAVHPDVTGKTDGRLGRPTLSLVYAAGQVGGRADAPLSAAAGPFTWVVAETYRRRAIALVPELTPDALCRDCLEQLVGAI